MNKHRTAAPLLRHTPEQAAPDGVSVVETERAEPGQLLELTEPIAVTFDPAQLPR